MIVSANFIVGDKSRRELNAFTISRGVGKKVTCGPGLFGKQHRVYLNTIIVSFEQTRRTYNLGPFAGPIYVVILIVDIFFFMILEWIVPRDSIHYVERDWTLERYREVGALCRVRYNLAEAILYQFAHDQHQ